MSTDTFIKKNKKNKTLSSAVVHLSIRFLEYPFQNATPSRAIIKQSDEDSQSNAIEAAS